jgi:hypothetical protein
LVLNHELGRTFDDVDLFQTNDDLPEVSANKELIFPSDTANIKDAYLVIVREKNSRYTLVRVS